MKKNVLVILSISVFLFLAFRLEEVFTQSGIASYYSSKFQGRRTASGAPYHKDSLTAAHRFVKFGTKLKVTNLSNDSVVIVTVTDRMTSKKHILDLSFAGAVQLNMVRSGVARVKIESLQ